MRSLTPVVINLDPDLTESLEGVSSYFGIRPSDPIFVGFFTTLFHGILHLDLNETRLIFHRFLEEELNFLYDHDEEVRLSEIFLQFIDEVYLRYAERGHVQLEALLDIYNLDPLTEYPYESFRVSVCPHFTFVLVH